MACLFVPGLSFRIVNGELVRANNRWSLCSDFGLSGLLRRAARLPFYSSQ
jgi:hypothetical protein